MLVGLAEADRRCGAKAANLGRLLRSGFTVPAGFVIEWATSRGQAWVLRARPITAAPDGAAPVTPASGEVLLAGTAASPGTAAGPARIITGLDDFGRLAPGDVLVCRTTSPAWTPLLARAAAVVTETGGLLAHAAIVAREFGIPAVLAAEDATGVLIDGQRVLVDGTGGTITDVDEERN